MMPFTFTKMHALGNDFVVLDNRQLTFTQHLALLTHFSDRHQGIGFDQALLIEPSTKADFFCRIINTDGSEAEQCGNGLRCVALYLKTKHLHTGTALTIETRAGVFPVRFCEDGEIEVTMGPPQSLIERQTLTLNHQDYQLSTVSMGNPHCLLTVPDINTAPVAALGALLNQHPHFKEGVNVGFMQIINPQLALLTTYERGVGVTLACGSNACAAAAVGIEEGILTSPVTIRFLLGALTLTYAGGHHPIRMKGPATLVFEGKIEAPANLHSQ